MDTEETSGASTETESPGGPAPISPSSPAPSRGFHVRPITWGRIGLGAVASFIVMALLYGLNNAMMLIGLLVICTVGFGLIPIFLVSWMVGWILLTLWDAIRRQTGRGGSTVAPGPSGG
jgi:hypothetical protein